MEASGRDGLADECWLLWSELHFRTLRRPDFRAGTPRLGAGAPVPNLTVGVLNRFAGRGGKWPWWRVFVTGRQSLRLGAESVGRTWGEVALMAGVCHWSSKACGRVLNRFAGRGGCLSLVAEACGWVLNRFAGRGGCLSLVAKACGWVLNRFTGRLGGSGRDGGCLSLLNLYAHNGKTG